MKYIKLNAFLRERDRIKKYPLFYLRNKVEL